VEETLFTANFSDAFIREGIQIPIALSRRSTFPTTVLFSLKQPQKSDSNLIFAGSVLVSGREELLL
jgi:hypothetical protein